MNEPNGSLGGKDGGSTFQLRRKQIGKVPLDQRLPSLPCNMGRCFLFVFSRGTYTKRKTNHFGVPSTRQTHIMYRVDSPFSSPIVLLNPFSDPMENVGTARHVPLQYLAVSKYRDPGFMLLPLGKSTQQRQKRRRRSSDDIPNSTRCCFLCSHHTAALTEPRRTLVKPGTLEPWWNPGGTLVEPSWNLTSGSRRTTPEPIWAETPKLSAVGEKNNKKQKASKNTMTRPCPSAPRIPHAGSWQCRSLQRWRTTAKALPKSRTNSMGVTCLDWGWNPFCGRFSGKPQGTSDFCGLLF